jgi:hypothetical protein
MRIYATTIVPATIQEKESSKHKVKKTKDDFEIVPEHEVKQLIECHCEICGAIADRFHWEEGAEGNSTLLALEIETYHSTHGSETRTEDFFGEGWYEVCEPCMRSKIIPYLQSLRCQQPALTLPELPHTSEQDRPHSMPQQLIGAEEEENARALPLPPLSDDEPF